MTMYLKSLVSDGAVYIAHMQSVITIWDDSYEQVLLALNRAGGSIALLPTVT